MKDGTPFVRPDVAAYVESVNTVAGPRLYEMSVPVARRIVRRLARQADLPVGDIAVDRALCFRADDGAEVGLRLFDTIPEREPGPVVLFFHGGGWTLGDCESYAPACAEIARQLGLPVVAVDYRRAPEWRSPTGQADCEAAARWVASRPAELPFAATSLVLAGDSCGGAYAISTAMALRDTPAALPVAAQLAFYPSADLATRYSSFREFSTGWLLDKHIMRWFAEAFAPDERDYRASPMAGDFTGLPPTVIVTASLDPLRDQGRACAAALASAGVRVLFREAAGMIHAFLSMRRVIPSAREDVRLALADLGHLIAEERAVTP